MVLILKKMNFNKLFLEHCNNKKLEINKNQFDIVECIHKFYQINFNNSILSKLFSKKIINLVFICKEIFE